MFVWHTELTCHCKKNNPDKTQTLAVRDCSTLQKSICVKLRYVRLGMTIMLCIFVPSCKSQGVCCGILFLIPLAIGFKH